MKRLISFLTLLAFLWTTIVPPSYAQSVFPLPKPGMMVPLSPAFVPLMIKGIKVNPENPLQLDFIIDTGHSHLKDTTLLKNESSKLIKYFLASLTIPEKDLWVNLSPYEKNRIIPNEFGHTDMGRDLLAQDYILKQLTASLIYPEDDLGKEFWEKVYDQAQTKYGTTDIPVNTFNKVWIVPEKAVVYENKDAAYVVESYLKVMLEEDYEALRLSSDNPKVQADGKRGVALDIIREVIIPAIEKEVNEGKNFIQLRQIYQALILATWFKRSLKESLLNKIYVGQNKIDGVDIEDKDAKDKIYQQYLEAFKVGVYNYIKEEYDPTIQEVVSKKYFSGGTFLGAVEQVYSDAGSLAEVQPQGDLLDYTVELTPLNKDAAMLNKEEVLRILEDSDWDLKKVRKGLNISTHKDYYDIFREYGLLSDLKAQLIERLKKYNRSIVHVAESMGSSRPVILNLMKKLNISRYAIDSKEVLDILNENNWDIGAMREGLGLVNVDTYAFFEGMGLLLELKNKLLERLDQHGWQIVTVAREFGMTGSVVSRLINQLKISQQAIHAKDILAMLEKNNWNIGKMREELKLPVIHGTYEFFEEHGLISELRAELVTALKENGWIISRVVKRFNVDYQTVIKLIEKFELVEPKISSLDLLGMLEMNHWNIGKIRKDLNIPVNQQTYSFFEELGVVDQLKSKLVERLEENNWIIATVAESFGLSSSTVKDMIQQFGLVKPSKVTIEEVEGMIDAELESIFLENVSVLSTRYSLDVKNILWGIIGSKLKGAFDREKIEELIDERIVEMVNDESQEGQKVESIGRVEGEENESEGPGFEPVVFEPKPLEQEEIAKIADTIESKLNNSDDPVEAGLRDMVWQQSVHFIRKLEERYFFKKYYQESPDAFTGKQAEEAIQQTLDKEKNSITKQVLQELLDEVREALKVQDLLHEKGLRLSTNLNLYQLMAVYRILKEKKVILADEMGLGKTLETIATFLLSEGVEMLVIGPKTILDRWMDDLGKHTDISLEVVLASDIEAGNALKQNGMIEVIDFKSSSERYEYLSSPRAPPVSGKKRIILANYESMPFFEEYRQRNQKPTLSVDFLALDEAHLLKNTIAQTSQAIYGDGSGKNGIDAKYKMILSGTPLENRPQDLLPPLKYLAQGGTSEAEVLLQNIDPTKFSRIFSKISIHTLSTLHGYLASKMIRRLKVDVVTGLPEKHFVHVRLNPLTGTMKRGDEAPESLPGDYRVQLDLYEMALQSPFAFERRYKNKLSPEEKDDDEDINGDQIWQKTTQEIRLEQAALDPGIFMDGVDSIKFDALKKLIEERKKEGKSVLIFTSSRKALNNLRKQLETILTKEEMAYVDGGVTGTPRKDEVDRFQDKKATVMLATIGTLGLGVELTYADSIIFLNYPWKPSSVNQAIDRAHRRDPKRNYPGKNLEVVFLELDVPVSIDKKKAYVLKKKSILSEMIVEGNLTKEILTAFQRSDLGVKEELKKAAEDPVLFDAYETSMLEKFRLLLGQVLQTKDVDRQRELWDQISEFYIQILEHKASFFANLASLDFLSGENFPELKSRPLKVLDAGSGPSTLKRAYQRNLSGFEERGMSMDIVDYDLSPQMLRLGVPREGGQYLGSFEKIGEAFADESFDIINLSYSYRYVTKPAKFIRDVHRILKKDGTLILILPTSNVVPPKFFEALEKAGFELRVGKGGKLQSRLDDKTYHALVTEYGQEFADDMAKEVKGEFTYLVASKQHPIDGELNDEDLRLARVIPKVGKDKVKSLMHKPGKLKLIPHEAMVEGRIVYLQDIFEADSSFEEDIKASLEPSSPVVIEKTGVARRLTKLIARISQLSQSMHSTNRFSERSKKRRAMLEHEISNKLELLQKAVEEQVETLDEKQKSELRHKIESLGKRDFVRQWFNQHEGVLESLLKSLTSQEKDAAMIINPKEENVGGIDLNTNNLDLQIKKEGTGVNFKVDPKNLENIPIDGFLPIIINIIPINNLPLFLGATEEENSAQLSQNNIN